MDWDIFWMSIYDAMFIQYLFLSELVNLLNKQSEWGTIKDRCMSNDYYLVRSFSVD